MTESNDRNLIFAVADLHGRYDLLEAAIEAIARYPGVAEAMRDVIFLGDYIDRGPEGAEVIERLIAGPPAGQRWICLKGNHEAMMSLALRDSDRLDWWIDNGGDATIASYRGAEDVIKDHLAWVETLPSICVKAKHVFVHAGLDRAVPLDKQTEMTLLWKRYRNGDGGGHDGRHIVHGHDPNVNGPLLFPGRTDLDTLAWRTGHLVVGVFDGLKGGGPIDLLDLEKQSAAAQPVW